MNIYGMLRVKNEARWIDRCIKSIQPACAKILVLDDHSTDGTPEMCEALGATVFRSEFQGCDETRDKTFLLSKIWEHAQPNDWCILIDGDEALEAGGAEKLASLARPDRNGYSFPIIYLWDREDQQRVDGVYGRFRRGSFFRLVPGHGFRRTVHGGNLHCASVPAPFVNSCVACDIRILHYGYMLREDRIRKYEWYNSVDKNDAVEDFYRHTVIGDLFPATSRFRWAGPLELKPLEALQ